MVGWWGGVGGWESVPDYASTVAKVVSPPRTAAELSDELRAVLVHVVGGGAVVGGAAALLVGLPTAVPDAQPHPLSGALLLGLEPRHARVHHTSSLRTAPHLTAPAPAPAPHRTPPSTPPPPLPPAPPHSIPPHPAAAEPVAFPHSFPPDPPVHLARRSAVRHRFGPRGRSSVTTIAQRDRIAYASKMTETRIATHAIYLSTTSIFRLTPGDRCFRLFLLNRQIKPVR